MIKSSEILMKEKCENRFRINRLDSKKGINYYNAMVIKEVFSTKGLDFEEEDLKEIVEKILPLRNFNTKKDYEINNQLLIGKLMRYKQFESRKELKKSSTGIVDVLGEDIRVDYDLILEDEDNDCISVIKFKNKKADLKDKGKSIHTKTSESIELFLLQQVGEKLGLNKKVYGSIVFLTGDKDKKDVLGDSFSIVQYSFEEDDITRMENRIYDIINNCGAECSVSECKQCSYNNICNFTYSNNTELNVITEEKKTGKVSFTESQMQFIEAIEGNYRVIAGAGSGKTTSIANRVVNLIQKGAKAEDILLITYTTNGVKELKDKINYWSNTYKTNKAVEKLNIHTFNNFGYELIKKEYKDLGFTEEPKVIDKISKFEIIKYLLDKYPKINGFDYKNPFMDFFGQKGCVIEMDYYFNLIKKNSLIYPEELIEESELKDEEIAISILKLYREYLSILKSNNFIDFEDQLHLAYKILSNPTNLKKYGYEHIIVDEYQDSNLIQVNILKTLSRYSFCKSLVVVGDDSQSIFSFTGAEQTNIIDFDKMFSNVKDIPMTENFRSTKIICELANFINDINTSKIDKKLVSKRNVGKISLTAVDKDIKLIIEKIKEDIKNGTALSDICVIARNKKELIDFKKELNLSNIPSVIAVSERLIDNDNVKNIINYSNFLIDETLDLHFAEYLQVTKNVEFTQALKDNQLRDFIEKEKGLFFTKYKGKDELSVFFNSLKEVSEKDECVKKLLKVCAEKRFSSIKDLNEYLLKLSMYQSDLFIEKSTENFQAVTLTTAHSSKGREFENVYLYVNQFNYPKYMTDESKNSKQIEEERRLLFVSLTRAKNNLFIFGNKDNSIYQEIKEGLIYIDSKVSKVSKVS